MSTDTAPRVKIVSIRQIEGGFKLRRPTPWHAPSVRALLNDPLRYLGQIPEEERFELYYEASRFDGEDRFVDQGTIFFDIDNIKLWEGQDVFGSACRALDLDEKKTGLVFTGGGVHVIIDMAQPLHDEGQFRSLRGGYYRACWLVQSALQEAGLDGVVDLTAFSKRRLFRLPGTLNKNRNARCVLGSSGIETQDFDLARFAPPPIKDLDQGQVEQHKIWLRELFVDLGLGEPTHEQVDEAYAMMIDRLRPLVLSRREPQ